MKTKAVFMIYLIVALTFAIYQIPEVQAQQQACCQYTVDGEACVYTDVARCDKGLKSFTTCDNTNYCKLGTCINQEEGTCSANVGRTQCLEQNGIWEDDVISNIAQCQPGCCQLGTECSFTTQQRCVLTASQFPGLQPIFQEAIQTESACINSCKSLERGACVLQDKTCELTTRALCTNGNFHANLLCSNPKLATTCAKQQTTNCLKEDVYWFDSCGNPENPYHSDKQLSYNNGILIPENKINQIYGIAQPNDPNNGNCEYPERNICGKKSGEYRCIDIDCSNTRRISNLDYTGGTKESGESWCLYESRIGFGYDVVGSRHSRVVCINGEELIEPCTDYRKEFCIQNKDLDGKLLQKQQFLNLGDGYSEAMCRPNRHDECSKANDPTLKCGGECNKYSGKEREFCCMRKACNDIQKRDCYWQESFNEIGGMCVPLVSPGIKFWDASASEDDCAQANQECKVAYERAGTEKTYNILGPEECTKKDWVISGNSLCKAQGDCGAWYNIEGKFSDSGFSHLTGDKRNTYELTQSDYGLWSVVADIGSKKDKEHDIKAFLNRGMTTLSLSTIALSGLYAYFAGGVFGSGLVSGMTYVGHLISGVTPKSSIVAASMGAFQIQAGTTITAEIATDFLGKEAIKKLVGKEVIKEITPEIAKELAKHGVKKAGDEYVATQTIQGGVTLGWDFLGTLLTIANFVAWAYIAYQIVDIAFADSKTETFETICKPWEAPDGGKDCEKCNDFLGGCSEYRCRSLGKACQLVNEGTEEENCVAVSQYDTKAPIIIKPTRGLGHTLQQKVKPFTPVELYLETDEPAHCKFSTEPNKKFEELEFDFGSSSFLYNHTLIFSLPSNVTQPEILQITNGGQYTLYTKCKDSNGNSNSRDYFYKFEIDKGPDLTAPKMEFLSIPTDSYIAHDVNQLAISALVSEPSTCNWDYTNKPFEQMQNEFFCEQNPFDYTSIYYGLYQCNTILSVTQNINNYFLKCRDQSGNIMSQSYKYTLKSTIPLQITSIAPQGTSNQENPTLTVQTIKGAQDGVAVCGYSETPNLPLQEIAMLQNTNSTTHEQQLFGLQARTYTYYVTCVDIAGNQNTKETTFEVTVDKQPPRINQIYIDNEILHIVTSEDSKCEYAHTPFSFESGISMTGNLDHQASIDPQQRTYYIKCQDDHKNIMSVTIYP